VAIIRLIQVFEEKACYFTFSLGSEISDRPSLWNGTTKFMVCLSCENSGGTLQLRVLYISSINIPPIIVINRV
jgi:hypothetical protein